MPSNIVLTRAGARRWLSFLVIIWGIIAALFATLKVCNLLLRLLESITEVSYWLIHESPYAFAPHTSKAALLILRDYDSHIGLALQDVKQFYVMRFLLGAAEVG